MGLEGRLRPCWLRSRCKALHPLLCGQKTGRRGWASLQRDVSEISSRVSSTFCLDPRMPPGFTLILKIAGTAEEMGCQQPSISPGNTKASSPLVSWEAQLLVPQPCSAVTVPLAPPLEPRLCMSLTTAGFSVSYSYHTHLCSKSAVKMVFLGHPDASEGPSTDAFAAFSLPPSCPTLTSPFLNCWPWRRDRCSGLAC